MAAIAGTPQKVQVIRNVHNDDIHGLLPLRDRTFITGSKDGSLKKWDFNGELVKVIYDPGQVRYTSWITALSTMGPDSWLSGTRDGYVHSWTNEGKMLRELRTPKRGGIDSRCKERNFQRITCLADFTLKRVRPEFLMGRPTQFTVHKSPDYEAVDGAKTSDNDWVYALHPLTETRVLVVTGGRLDLLEKEGKLWKMIPLLREGQRLNGQRPFISAITPLRGNASLFGLSIFNGRIAVYDLEARKILMTAQEHLKRVWTIENVNETSFASCADDGQIKLWDVRMNQSVSTMIDNPEIPSRVSVLFSPEDHRLISGSCPDDVMELDEKASLSIWDLRKG